MATSQQGKKKKKVLSQQQIDKLLGMLREEDKPLRAGILAKTLGYQSAKDINPTLLRLEGYGMVSRVTMNNTPLWKYVGREGIAVMTSSSRTEDDVIKDNMDGVRILAGPRLQHENGAMHPVLEGRDDSCPSRPQSTKADLEWDPTDIQAHRDDDMLHGPPDVGAGGDFHQMSTYNENGSAPSFVTSQHGMPMHTKDLMGTPPDRLTTSTAVLNGTRLNGATLNGVGMADVSGLNFTTNQGYVAQDLYGTMESRTDQMGVHGMNMNGLDTKMTNGQSFVGQDYTGMSGYNEGGEVSMNGGHGTNMNSTMQNNYNLDYAQQNSQNDNGRGGTNDMYMLSNNNMRHMTNGIGNNSMPSNLQNFALPPNQVHSDYPHSNSYTSSVSSTGMNPKSSTSSSQTMQNYSRENHNHSHYNQNSYNSNSNNMGRNSQVMPTYVVREIIKPETVGQFGMAGPQGPPETRNVGGYQSMHPHPHGLDPGVMSYSQQPYHTAGGLSNGGPSTQHHHHQQQQPQQQIPAQQHHQQHHQHHQPHHHHHHPQHHHPQQQPLTQAANFVNVGTFTNGTYNQFQGTFGLGASSRAFSGQHPQGTGYGSGSITSKDLANFSGTGMAYRGGQLKRQQHFNGYTNTGLFPNHVRPPVFGKMGQARQPFLKHGFNRNHMDKPRGPHNRNKANGGQGRGPKLNNGNFDETKAKLGGGGCGEKDQSKTEVNKYMGTEVLDDICRRLNKHVSVQKKSPEQTRQQEDTSKCKTEPSNSAKDEKKEEKSENSDKEKPSSVNSTAKASEGSKDSNSNSSGTNGEKLTNGKEQPVAGARPQNNQRGEGGPKYQHYPYRGGYHSRETSRHHHHRNSSRNSNGRTKGSDNAGSSKPANQNQSNKVLSGPPANGKAEDIKTTKDASQGSEPSKLAEVKCSEVGAAPEQAQDDRPMAKYRSLLTDHLDPNNVLLSHLFVRGLIDRVLVDQVRRMKTRRDAMDCLLPALLGIAKDAIGAGFCDALQKSGQVYLAELIKATGIAGEAMTDKHAAFLKLHHQNIAASMIPDKELLAYLRTDSVLTQDLHRFVSTQPSRAQQIDTLLQVLPFRGDKAFETFRTALRRSGQPWLAEQIAMELT